MGGSEKSSFSAFIDKLNNGDWIHRGLSYLDASVDICPFCQSKISDKIISEIKNYFNKEYQSDITTLNHLYNNFTIYVKEYAEDLNSINKNYSEFLKNTQFELKANLSLSYLNESINKIRKKIESPSTTVTKDEFNSYASYCDEISQILNNVNILITKDNKLFNNISDEKEKLKSDFIRYAFSNVNVDFIEKDIDILKSEVKSLTKDVLDLEKREREIDESLDKINNKFQNTEIVCKCINRYLHDYGYSSFLLKYNSESTYSIIREDGEEALKTLSEGEKNFLAFLYFYFTIKNSENYIALNNYDVVAIDDPISSLDSHALYIVSQLTLDLIDDLTFKHKNKVPGQIFIFSHNLFYINDIDSSLTANKNKLSRRYFILKKTR